MTVLRKGVELTLPVIVVERAGDPRRFSDLVDAEESRVSRLGILGISVDDELRQLIPGMAMESGVLVAARTPGAPPAADEFRLGDIILSLNGRRVGDVVDMRVILGRIEERAPIVAHVERDGIRRYVTLVGN